MQDYRTATPEELADDAARHARAIWLLKEERRKQVEAARNERRLAAYKVKRFEHCRSHGFV